MSQITLYIAHYLTEDEARSRIKCLTGELAGRFASDLNIHQLEWSGNIGRFSLSIRGVPVTGQVTVFPREIDLIGEFDSDDPGLSHTVEKVICERSSLLLA